MDHSQQQHGEVNDIKQEEVIDIKQEEVTDIAYRMFQYLARPGVITRTIVFVPSPTQAPRFYLQLQQRAFWAKQMREIENTTDSRNHSLPLTCIKKIMKSDEDVRMVSAEAPVLFAKACEMFIMDLTMRSWSHTKENRRRALQWPDITTAIARTDIFDFLISIVPKDQLENTKATIPLMGPPPAVSVSYHYVPQQHSGTSRV